MSWEVIQPIRIDKVLSTGIPRAKQGCRRYFGCIHFLPGDYSKQLDGFSLGFHRIDYRLSNSLTGNLKTTLFYLSVAKHIPSGYMFSCFKFISLLRATHFCLTIT